MFNKLRKAIYQNANENVLFSKDLRGWQFENLSSSITLILGRNTKLAENETKRGIACYIRMPNQDKSEWIYL